MSIEKRFGITQIPTPVFNTPNIEKEFGGASGSDLNRDEKGLIRCVETILPIGSLVELVEEIKNGAIWRIRTEEYPSQDPLYIDSRSIHVKVGNVFKRNKKIPSANEIVEMLSTMKHCDYIWGGNDPEGIELMTSYYHGQVPFHQLPLKTQNIWKLAGMDCSGLPYFITNGATPRNTSELIRFGSPVHIEGLAQAQEIIKTLQPLDFIVWKGHVVWVLSRAQTIESRHPMGLIRYQLEERLTEIMKERIPVDNYEGHDEPRFVVRRWHPEKIDQGSIQEKKFIV